jgi:membrane dipeptidase
VVGIAFFAEAVGETSVAAIVRAIDHAVAVVGVDHVALGSDFDGAVTVPVDAGRLMAITAALLAHGFAEEEIGKIMGLNIVRVLAAALPEVGP